MFFFAFQEYVSYVSEKTICKLDEKECTLYIQQYVAFCRKHNLIDNIQDVYWERKKVGSR